MIKVASPITEAQKQQMKKHAELLAELQQRVKGKSITGIKGDTLLTDLLLLIAVRLGLATSDGTIL